MKQLILTTATLLFITCSYCQDVDAFYRDQQSKMQDEEKLIANWPIDSATKQILFTGVVQVPNASAQELYSRAKLFVADTYKSGKDVTQLNDDVARVVLITPAMDVVYFDGIMNNSAFVHFQIKIECKDNRYRYSIDGFTVQRQDYYSKKYIDYLFTQKKPNWIWKKPWIHLQENTIIDTNSLVRLLNKRMSIAISDF